ncbi:hypothetical protein SBOR_2201 [Sclerotinia borealis F-4128]|uniref:Signal peptide-containing protein n=1 Tax=Sclerotinia borealis (strain F-4128) TaxID=1432307 RepID=W9CN20_SCLBF|nr:hypothetical protein SBOR_2201 [Sclerotinia borealis F-4128]
MQFFTIPVFAIFAIGALAMPSNLGAPELETPALKARDTCDTVLPACFGGSIVGAKTTCRCDGQKAKGDCDVWVCPGSSTSVVSFFLPIAAQLLLA